MARDACSYREDILVEGLVEPPAKGLLEGLLPNGTRLWRMSGAGIHHQRHECVSLLRGGSALLRVGCALLWGRSLLLSIGILFCLCSLLCTPGRAFCSPLGGSMTCRQSSKATASFRKVM